MSEQRLLAWADWVGRAAVCEEHGHPKTVDLEKFDGLVCWCVVVEHENP